MKMKMKMIKKIDQNEIIKEKNDHCDKIIKKSKLLEIK